MSLSIDYGGGQRNSFANPATCRHSWAFGWQKPHEVKPVKVCSRPFGMHSHLPRVTLSVSRLRLDSLTPAHRGVRGAMTIRRARAVALLVGPSQVGSVLPGRTTMAQGFRELQRCLVQLNADIRTQKLLIATSSHRQVWMIPDLERTFRQEVELDCVRLFIVPSTPARVAP